MRALERRTLLPLCAVLAFVCLAYANHFGNSFHFDDSHTIADNPYIRETKESALARRRSG